MKKRKERFLTMSLIVFFIAVGSVSDAPSIAEESIVDDTGVPAGFSSEMEYNAGSRINEAENQLKPEGGILLSGDCSDYQDLSGLPLPISVTGTTAGATNDYGPYPSRPGCWQVGWSTGSCSGPDMTYKWTAPADGYYTIETCNSGYDSDISLYNFTCPVEPVYPDDFICGNSGGLCSMNPPNPAGLHSIYLDQDQEILIVVDGFESNYGNFELAIYQGDPPPQPFECPENSTFNQPASGPFDPISVWNSDVYSGYTVFDNLPELFGTICEISFWGFDVYWNSSWFECEEDPMSFVISFYEDSAGYPGAMICSQNIFLTRTPTGVYYAGTELNYYQGTLYPCCEVNGGWISIRGSSYGGFPQDCYFLWLNSQEGDDLCYQWVNNQFVNRGTSMSLCLGDSMMSGVEDELREDSLPISLSVNQNHPNPFNASTSIKYDLPSSCEVTIEIYDLLGRKIQTLSPGEQQPGLHSIAWKADGYSSGVYFYRIQAGEYIETKKMLLLK